MKTLFTLVLVVALATINVYAQAPALASTSIDQSAPVATPVISPELKAELQLVYTKRLLTQEQANRLQLEYEKTVKALSDQFAKLSAALSASIDQAFADAKVDRKDFDIDLEKGEFIKTPPKPKQ